MPYFQRILPLEYGSEATIFEVALYSHFRHKNSEKSDVLFIIYKDAEGNKKVQAIKNPKVEIYFAKPEYRTAWRTPREYIETEKVYPVIIEPRNILKRIYQELQECHDSRSEALKKIYEQACASGDWKARKEILKSQLTFMSDISVEEFYRIALGLQYQLTRAHEVNKGFLDIESDIYGLTTSEADANLDPTNAVTVIFDYNPNKRAKPEDRNRPQVFTFLLRNHRRYKQQAYFEEHLDDFIKQCHKEFDKIKVTKKDKSVYMETNADYHINFFDNEADLHRAVFKVINSAKPDIMAIWNLAYDIPKMAARQEKLGMDYVENMCDPAFPASCRFVEINVDNRGGVDIANRKTFMKIASTTKFIDQMQNYAQLRKGQKSYGSNKLDNIGEIELGIHKREFRQGIDVTNAAIEDYWNFVLYNINDVWMQVLIERVTNDLFAIVFDANQHSCSFENLTKQTKYQKQIYYPEYIKRGHVPGNNKNNDYVRGVIEDYADIIEESARARRLRKLIDESGGDIDSVDIDSLDELTEDEEYDLSDEDAAVTKDILSKIENVYNDSIERKLKLKGGLVGNPNLNSCNGVELIKGSPSKHIFPEIVDMDYSSEYPWAKYTRSISRSTQYGRLIIGKKISPRQNEHEVSGYLPGAEFISDYISQDYISFGNVWFGMPTVQEAIEEAKKILGGVIDG